MRKFIIVSTIILFLSLNFAPKPAFAADCTMIYGGGEIKCDNPVTPTLAPQSPKGDVGSPTKSNQTKGGLNVQKPTNVSKTPATGPETIGLISLIPMAAAGFYLRKKTNKRTA